MPTHEEISFRAFKLWQDHGHPVGRDTELWLQAEYQLSEKHHEQTTATPPKETKAALLERVKSETAAESVIENNMPASTPEEAAIKAAMLKQAAQAPQVPHHTGPKNKPPETGKPLYKRPHSS